MSISITLKQTNFTLPLTGDRDTLHKAVYENLMEHQHAPKGREFVYSVKPIDAGQTLALVKARAIKFAEGIPSADEELTIRDPSNVMIRVQVAAGKRQSRDNSTQFKAVPDRELLPWFQDLIARHGMTFVSGRLRNYQQYFMPGKGFFVPMAEFEATVSIFDTEKFVNAYISGIGRKKAYGMGMLQVIEE